MIEQRIHKYCAFKQVIYQFSKQRIFVLHSKQAFIKESTYFINLLLLQDYYLSLVANKPNEYSLLFKLLKELKNMRIIDLITIISENNNIFYYERQVVQYFAVNLPLISQLYKICCLMDSPKKVKEYLKLKLEGEVESVIQTILDAANEISSFLRHSPIFKLETSNDFGDEQLHQDVHCDEVIEKHLKRNPLVKAFASEERPTYTEIGKGDGYVVTFDPLDGSSIVDTNFAIGSIFSIWKTDQRKLIGVKLREQVNAVITIFGPRTTAVFYNASVNKVQEVTSVDDHWIISHDHLVIKKDTTIFSPGNLRSASDNLEYREAIVGWIARGLTLRYTGGLVVDVYQIFIKGHGIFSNCGSAKHKCKLRALYEAAALGYLIEKAEGTTITAGKGSLLDYVVKGYDDRLSFGMGSANEIEYLKNLF